MRCNTDRPHVRPDRPWLASLGWKRVAEIGPGEYVRYCGVVWATRQEGDRTVVTFDCGHGRSWPSNDEVQVLDIGSESAA